jgi:hypothetical protein
MDKSCVYKNSSGSAVVFQILYIDDILLIGNDISLLSLVNIQLSKSFSMKDIREATYILGIQIYRGKFKRLLGLSQFMYIDKMLEHFSMKECNR